MEFQYSLAGKPHLAGKEQVADISFNLSHDGLLCLYAISRGHAVGIDVKCIRPMAEKKGIARWIFPPVSGKARRRAFYNGWTRKEAYL